MSEVWRVSQIAWCPTIRVMLYLQVKRVNIEILHVSGVFDDEVEDFLFFYFRQLSFSFWSSLFLDDGLSLVVKVSGDNGVA